MAKRIWVVRDSANDENVAAYTHKPTQQELYNDFKQDMEDYDGTFKEYIRDSFDITSVELIR